MHQLYRLFFLAFINLAFSATATGDVPIADAKVSYTTPSDWVRIQPYNENILDGQATGGPAYALISRQRKLDDRDSYLYARFVQKLNDLDSIEESSQLSFTFDPSYQELVLHWVRVKRGDTVTERLDPGRVQILHTENSADRLIYNGDVSATFVLKDIRVGDVIDYAYSLKGKNPVFNGHITTGQRTGYSVPVGRQYIRFDLPDDRPYTLKTYSGASQPATNKQNGRLEYVWDIAISEGQNLDEYVPSWHEELPYVEITDMQSWQQLGAFYQPYYTAPQTISANLQQQIDDIAATFHTDKERARAALDFVQGNIRYLGIEMGAGGYAPRDPSQVLEQRFGDCKDKTMLLITMLDRLGIEAHPTLVDTDFRDKFDSFLPTSGSFDHVITEILIDGASYWVDPTKDSQLGDLDHLEQSSLGKGLTINGPQSQIKTFPSKEAPEMPTASVTETFYFTNVKAAFDYKITSIYRGSEADTFLRDINSDGLDNKQQAYLELYQKTFPETKVVTPMVYETDGINGAVTVTEHYRVTNGWEKTEDGSSQAITLYPYWVRSHMPTTNTSARSAPFNLGSPSFVEHTLVFQVDDSWNFTPDHKDIVNEYFEFHKTGNYDDENHIYTQYYSYKTKKTFVPTGDHQQQMKALDDALGESGIELTYRFSNTATSSAAKEDNDTTYVLWIFGVLALVALFIFYRAVLLDASYRKDTVFYPVTTRKYLVMSLFSFGFYYIFWMFKNWQWVRDVDGDRVSPALRTIFSGIWVFSLLIRIGERKDNLLKFAIPAGIVFWIISLSNYISDAYWGEESMESSIVLVISLFLPTLLFLPYVLGIKNLNSRQKNALGYEAMLVNSRYTWHSWVTIGLVTALSGLIIFGAFFV